MKSLAVSIVCFLTLGVMVSFGEQNQQSYEEYVRKGYDAYKKGQLESAIGYLRIALEYNPGDPKTEKVIRSIEGKLDQQSIILQNSREDQYRHYYSRGLDLVKQRKLEEAKMYFEKSLIYKPHDSEATQAISLINSSLNKKNNIESVFEPATKHHYTKLTAIAEYFRWSEYDDEGYLLLEETGMMSGVELDYRYSRNLKYWLEIRGQIFGGTLDYDGQTQAGDPLKDETGYHGYEANIHHDVFVLGEASDQARIALYLGLGYREWLRELRDYDEDWQMAYGIIGARGDINSKSGRNWFGQLEFRGGQNRETIGLPEVWGGTPVEVEPGKGYHVYMCAGTTKNLTSAQIYIQAMEFSKSDVAFAPSPSGTVGIYQPESIAAMIGVQFGFAF